MNDKYTARVKLCRTASLGYSRSGHHGKYSFRDRSTREEASLNDRTKTSNKTKPVIVIMERSDGLKDGRRISNERSNSISKAELSSRLYHRESNKKQPFNKSASPKIKKSLFNLKGSIRRPNFIREDANESSIQTQSLIRKLESAVRERINGSVNKSRILNSRSKSDTSIKSRIICQAASGNTVIHTEEREKLHRFVEIDTQFELLNYDGKEVPGYMKSWFIDEKQ